LYRIKINRHEYDETKHQYFTKKLWIITASVAALVIILVFLYFQSKSEMKEVVQVMTEEKMDLTMEYQNLAIDYDSLKTNNQAINEKLELERERVSNLLEELKNCKSDQCS
jgi:hypothetical protein